MKISFKQFFAQLTGARYMDEYRWTKLKYEESLWEMFAFDDSGATYLDAYARRAVAEPDWGSWVKNSAGYFEPEGMVIQ